MIGLWSARYVNTQSFDNNPDPYQVKRSLKTFRENGDVRGCVGVLQTCIRSNFAAIESSRCVIALLAFNPLTLFARLYSEVSDSTLSEIQALSLSLDLLGHKGLD